MRKLLFILLFIPTILCGQRIYYIDPGGSDSHGDGSAVSPWRSLKKASQEVTVPNSIIYVNPGTYNENDIINIAVGVSIQGFSKEQVRVESMYSGSYQPLLKLETWNGWNGTYGNQSISGITFDGNLITYSCISVNFRSNVIIYDCNFYAFSRRGVVFWGAPYDYWGDVLPYYTSHKMPDKWCTGNKIYDCYFENCAYYGTNGTGNLNFGQQDGFEAYNITIDQTARLGYGIKFYERGFNKNTKIYNCDIEVQPRPKNTEVNTYYNFAMEMWWDMGGCEYYNNRLRGHFDITGTVDVESGYTSWVHDNIIGWDVTTDHLEVGLSLEAIIYDVIINNNVFKNVTSGVMFQQLFPNDDWPIDNHMENLQVYNNIITVGIVPGGWTYGQLVGISFTEGRGDKTGKDAFIYNNTVICKGFGSRTDIYGVAGISYYCYTDWDGFYVKNNIFQGFTGGTLRSGFFVGVGYSEMNYLTFENNLLYGNGHGNQPYFTSDFDSGTNYSMADNVTASPGFVSPFDYHLDDGSPAIAAGQYVGLLTDFDGYQWLNPPSIGAYEYMSEIPEDPDPPGPDPPGPKPPAHIGKIVRQIGQIVKNNGKIVKR